MHFNRNITLGNTTISDTSPTYIIAEAGVNHGGDIELAKKLIDIAAAANVDAVKFQAFKSENLILKNVKKAPYQIRTTSPQESQFEMLKKLEISVKQNEILKKYCEQKGVFFLVTPYDEESVEELIEVGVDAFKIASTDTTNLPFIKMVASKNKPIFFSTGMSYDAEIALALEEMNPINKDVILLQCSSNYPIADEDVHLNVMKKFMQEYDMIVGYSDHSPSVGAAPYAVAAGAKVVEKHFTIDKNLPGPDHKASLDPEELTLFVKEVRKVEKYLGSSIKIPSIEEKETRKSLQKCLVSKKAIKKGEQFSIDNVTAKRTGGEGISPIYYRTVFTKKAHKDYAADEIIEL